MSSAAPGDAKEASIVNAGEQAKCPKPFPGAAYDLVAVACSAGGLRALSALLGELPSSLPAAIVIVQHLAPNRLSLLPDILSRRTSLAIKQAEDGDCLHPGVAYLAPPDLHLLVNDDGSLSLSGTLPIHFSRPSADTLFESAAASYGRRLIAVVLTGAGSDGAAGVKAVKRSGGLVIAQDEASSEFYGMPAAAAETGDVDYVAALAEIPAMLIKLVTEGKSE